MRHSIQKTSLAVLGFLVFPKIIWAFSFEQKNITLFLSSGKSISAQIRIPTSHTQNPDRTLPALMVFGGFQGAARVLDLFTPTHPIVLASFDYPFSPPRKFKFPESLSYLPEAKRTIHETIEGIRILHQTLLNHPRVDPNRTLLLGASFGAPFVSLAGADLTSLQGAIIIHGFGDPIEAIAKQFLKKWEPKWGVLAYLPAYTLGMLGWLYLGLEPLEKSAEKFNASQKVYWIEAQEESSFTKKSRELMKNALKKSKAKIDFDFTPGDHLAPGENEKINLLTQKVITWMIKESFL